MVLYQPRNYFHIETVVKVNYVQGTTTLHQLVTVLLKETNTVQRLTPENTFNQFLIPSLNII